MGCLLSLAVEVYGGDYEQGGGLDAEAGVAERYAMEAGRNGRFCFGLRKVAFRPDKNYYFGVGCILSFAMYEGCLQGICNKRLRIRIAAVTD